MRKPLFSIVLIAKNESQTLPRLMASLKEFQDVGGEVVLVDTNSSDGAPDVARSLGCVVYEAGDQFVGAIDEDTAKAINEHFVVDDEAPVVSAGDTLFDFAAARNYAASKATNDWVFMADADEQLTVLNIDEINKILEKPSVASVTYEFVFAHDHAGNPAVQFISSKLYRRSAESWSGCVHEVRHSINPECCEIPYITPEILKLDHYQNSASHRSHYLKGLMVDCFQNPEKDRQSHYAARELLWTGRPKSALKEFKRHIAMDRWPAERAQSMIFAGDCEGQLGRPDLQCEWYQRAFYLDPTRREALIKLAYFYKSTGQHAASAAYASAAMEIPWHGFYANEVPHYRDVPYFLRYTARGWLGNVTGAQADLLEALKYNAFHPDYNRDVAFFFEYDTNKAPEGWMVAPELLWLHDSAKGKKRILELGSWKGRSTHALCTGAAKTGGTVYAVDHFRGSVGEDVNHAEAKEGDAVYNQFLENTKELSKLVVRRADSLEAVKEFPDGFFDMAFLDGSHDEESVRKDIEAWLPKVANGGLFCGHDWVTWPGVMAGVRSTVGEPDSVHTSIWTKRLEPRPANPLLQYLTSCVRDGKPCSFVKLGDGEQACMDGEKGANCDGHPYSPELSWKLKMAFAALEKISAPREGRTWVNVVPFKDQPFYNCILYRNSNNLDAIKDFWGSIRQSTAHKIFIGPLRLKPAADMLKAEFIEIPLVNCFSAYDSIREKLMWHAKPGTIAVFCASMMAKILIANLLERQPNMSCIDAGSAFDSMFVGKTRTEQLPMDLLLREHREWLGEGSDAV